MDTSPLVLYGADPLFAVEDGIRLDDAWAHRRYRNRLAPFVWHSLLAAVCAAVGLPLAVQGGLLLLPAMLALFAAFWNGFQAWEDWTEATAGFAMLRVVRSQPMLDFFRVWAAHAADRLAAGDLSFNDINPYADDTALEHVHAQRTTDAIGHDQFLAVIFSRDDHNVWSHFPNGRFKCTIEAVGKTGRREAPFMTLRVARRVDPPAFPEDDGRFDRLRRRAAVVQLQSTFLTLPLSGNPTGTAHGRMAYLNALRTAIPS